MTATAIINKTRNGELGDARRTGRGMMHTTHPPGFDGIHRCQIFGRLALLAGLVQGFRLRYHSTNDVIADARAGSLAWATSQNETQTLPGATTASNGTHPRRQQTAQQQCMKQR